MAIFTFPSSPVTGQSYKAPNGVTYVWDSEKWVGSGSAAASAGDFLDKSPLPSNEQVITPGQATDRALRIRALPAQSGNLLEFSDAAGLPLTVFDEQGRLGIGTSNPTYPLEVIGDMSLTGALRANGSVGLPGQHLVSDGIKAYWENDKLWTLDSVLAAGNVTSRAMTVGNMNVQGNLNVTGTQTIINTEVIKLADNIITLNSNYAGSTPNENAGLEVNRGTLAAKYFFWDETLDQWSIGTDTFTAGLFKGPLIGNVTGTVSSLANHTTTDVAEGTNLYFTNARARAAITTTGDLAYDSATGVMSYTTPVRTVNGKLGNVVLTTDDIVEGPTNKYLNTSNLISFLQQRSINDLSDVNTDGVANGDILYWDATAGSFKTIPGDFQDDFITNLAFTSTDGLLKATRQDGTLLTTSMDGRYLPLTGGTLTGQLVAPSVRTIDLTVTGNTALQGNTVMNSDLEVWGDTVLQGNVRVWGTLSANTVDIVMSQLADVQDINAANGQVLTWNSTTVQWEPKTPVLSANATFDATTGVVTTTRNDGTTYTVDLDGRYLETAAGGTVAGFTTFTGGLQSNVAPLAANDVTNKAYVDAALAAGEVFTNTAVFDITTGVITQTRNNGTTYAVDIDGRYVVEPVATSAGNVLTWNGTSWTAANVAINLNDVLDVDVTGAVTGDLLRYNAATQTWGVISINDVTPDTYVTSATVDALGVMTLAHNTGTTVVVDMATGLDARFVNVAGDTMTGPLLLAANPTVPTGAATKAYVDGLVANSEVTVNAVSFSTLDGNLVIQDTKGVDFAINLDGRYLELTDGGTVAGNTVFGNKVQSATVPTLANDLTNKTYVDSLVANSEVTISGFTFSNADGNLVITETNGSVRGVDLDGRYLGLTDGGIVTGATTFNTGLQSLLAPVAATDVTNKSYVDALVANAEIFTSSAGFDSTTGVLTQTRNNATTYTVNLDGRYAKSVNGIAPDASGNVLLSLTATSTGTLGAIPASANNGSIYIVSGDTDANNNGETYIYNAGVWTRIVSFDQAQSDLRYINTAGDAMTGQLLLASDPTVAGQAATKNYVDLMVANSEVSINAVSFSALTGNLVIQDTKGVNFAVDLDGRYLGLTDGGTVAGATTFSGALQTPTVPTVANDVANKAYVDAKAAASEISVSGFSLTGANLVITETNGNTHLVDIFAGGLDARYVNASGDTMTGDLILNAAPTLALGAATKGYVDAAIIAGEVYTNTASFNIADGVLTQTRNDLTTYTVDLDGRYVVLPTGATTGQVLTWNGVDWTASNTAADLADLGDVDVTGVANGSILYYDATATKWKVIAGDFVDNFISNASFNPADGVVTLTKNDATTVTVDLDGRYLELATGGTVAGPTTFSSTIQSATTPTVANDLTNKAYVDATILAGEVYTNTAAFDSTTGVITQTRNNGTTYTVDIDGRYLELTAGGTVAGPTTFSGALQTPTAPTVANDVVNKAYADALAANSVVEVADVSLVAGVLTITETSKAANTTHTVDLFAGLDARYVNVAGDTMTGALTLPADPTLALEAATKQYVDAKAAAATSEIATAAWDSTTGNITITETAAAANTVHTFSIDGRYAKTVNGIVPDAAGNIPVSLTAVKTGTDTARPLTETAGTVYVVSGDANTSLNGKTYIYEAVSAAWYEVKGFDTAAADARYVNISGDAMVGQLTLASDPTVALQAATKNYVDTLVANSEVSINAVSFSLADGNLVIQDTKGVNFAVDLDGRYLETATGGTVAGATVFSSTLQTPTAPTVANDVTNKAYVDAKAAAATIEIADVTLDAAGVLTITETANAANTTHTVNLFTGLDARYVNVAGDTMTGDLVLNAAPTLALGAATKGYVDALVANSEVTVNAVSFSLTDGNLVIQDTKGVNFAVDLDGRYIVQPTVAATAGQALVWNGTDWIANTIASTDTKLSTIAFGADGNLVITDTAGTNFGIDLDGRYLQLAAGGTVAGATLYTGGLQSNVAPVAGDDVANKTYVDAKAAAAAIEIVDVALDATTGVLTITETANAANTPHTVNLFTGLDARYVNAAGDTMSGDLVVAGNVEVQGTLIANNTTLTLGKLADVADAAATANQVLTWNGTQWVGQSLPSGTTDTFLASAAISAADLVTFTKSDGGIVTLDLASKWLSLANGGTVAGNTVFTANVQTATVPTVANDITNKAYVDALVANSEVTVNAVSFSSLDGNLVIQDTKGVNFAVDLDGRYLVPPTATANGQVLTWNNATSVWEAQTPASGVTTLALLTDVNTTGVANGQVLTYDTATSKWVALTPSATGFDNYVASGAFVANSTVSTLSLVYANTAVANAVVSLAHNIDSHTDVDTTTVAPTAGQVLSWNGVNWVPATKTHVTISDTAPLAPADGDEWYDSLTNFRTYVWSATAAAWLDMAPSGSGGSSFDNYVTSGSFVANSTVSTLSLAYANTSIASATVSLAHNIDSHTDVDTTTVAPISGSSVLGWNGANWVPVEVLDASTGAANDF